MIWFNVRITDLIKCFQDILGVTHFGLVGLAKNQILESKFCYEGNKYKIILGFKILFCRRILVILKLVSAPNKIKEKKQFC